MKNIGSMSSEFIAAEQALYDAQEVMFAANTIMEQEKRADITRLALESGLKKDDVVTCANRSGKFMIVGFEWIDLRSLSPVVTPQNNWPKNPFAVSAFLRKAGGHRVLGAVPITDLRKSAE